MTWKGRCLITMVAASTAISLAAAARRRNDAVDPGGALARITTLYDRGAARYDVAMGVLDRLLFAEGRRWVAEQARGEVLELAAGTGRNLPFYALDAQLTALDVSPVMLEAARMRAEALGRRVQVHIGDAQALDFPDAAFDSVVCTLGLCTIPDERRAVQEAWRVLRPGGHLLLLEHVSSPYAPVRLVQRLLDPLACLLASDHLTRDPLPVVAGTGFDILRVERHALGIVQRLAARKPTSMVPSSAARRT